MSAHAVGHQRATARDDADDSTVDSTLHGKVGMLADADVVQQGESGATTTRSPAGVGPPGRLEDQQGMTPSVSANGSSYMCLFG